MCAVLPEVVAKCASVGLFQRVVSIATATTNTRPQWIGASVFQPQSLLCWLQHMAKVHTYVWCCGAG